MAVAAESHSLAVAVGAMKSVLATAAAMESVGVGGGIYVGSGGICWRGICDGGCMLIQSRKLF